MTVLGARVAVVVGVPLLVGMMSAPSQGQVRDGAAPGYAKLTVLGERLPKRGGPKYARQDFITNWAVRDLSRPDASPVAFAADEDVPGVRVHRSEILIQLKRDIDPAVAADFIEGLPGKYDVTVVDSAPEIGLLLVSLRSGSERVGRPIPQDVMAKVGALELPNFRRVHGIESVLEDLRGEDVVQAAAPNTLVGVTALPRATAVQGFDRDGNPHVWDWRAGPGSPAQAKRDGNWGLKATGFPAAWNFNGAIRRRAGGSAPPAVHVGVLDVGFRRHQDLSETLHFSPITVTSPEDHGNHVSGIIGAAWNDSGVSGCSPFVRLTAATMQDVPFAADVASPEISFAMFDILSGVGKFILEHADDDLKVVNVSLGYNWVRNEQVDPNVDRKVQRIVEQQGIMMRTLADWADEQGIIIVSAAGNDSRPGPPALTVEAVWASPFNWAAFNAGPYPGPATNVIVVEAVGRAGAISKFSNVHGCVSAPGEGILSCVASSNPLRGRSEDAVPSETHYAPNDGTSMAAPHVSGLIALMYAYNPDLPHRRVLEILGVAGENRRAPATPAPCINAFDALVECREESLQDLADLDDDGDVDPADFQRFKEQLEKVEAGATEDLNGDGIASGSEGWFHRADLNGDGQLLRSPQALRKVKGELSDDLGVMMRAWPRNGEIPAADLREMLEN